MKLSGTRRSAGNGKLHAHFAVHDHCFVPDRVRIDVHVSVQKMFRL